jgi:serine/threonine protein kinase
VSTVPNPSNDAPESALQRQVAGVDGAVLTDDTPTVELLAGRERPAAMRETGSELAPGCVLCARYVLEEVVGLGGTSIIFRARDLHQASCRDTAASVVAVKLLRPELRADPQALMRLQREFRQMQCLSHPGIVRVFDLECDGDAWFISMQLVAGRTVKSWIQTPGSHANALSIIARCCQALEHAHSAGILHGDLKPTNVMVADDGAVKLIDFGSVPSPGTAAAAGTDPTSTGTPLYASPQILAGKAAEPGDDVFSLACLSYSLLSGGRHPFGGRPSLEDGRMKSAPTYVRTIPAGLFEVIQRGLSAEREERPASVGQFLRELTEADRRSRSMLPVLFKQMHRGARRPALRIATARAPPTLAMIADTFGGGAASFGRAQPFVRLTAVVLAIVSAAVLFRLETHRDMIRSAALPPAAPGTTLGLIATAHAQTEALPGLRPVLHDSGVISFVAPTVHASAAQSLVAISVKRLQAINSRGAFAWRVERGTAYPGVDYARMDPQVVRFIEGQSVRTLFIPLINTGATLLPHVPRTFTVALEQVAGGPALGRIARVTVAIDPPPTLSRTAIYQARAAQ